MTGSSTQQFTQQQIRITGAAMYTDCKQQKYTLINNCTTTTATIVLTVVFQVNLGKTDVTPAILSHHFIA